MVLLQNPTQYIPFIDCLPTGVSFPHPTSASWDHGPHLSAPQAGGLEQQDLLPHRSGVRRSEIKQTEGRLLLRAMKEDYLPGVSLSSRSLLAVSGILWFVD